MNTIGPNSKPALDRSFMDRGACIDLPPALFFPERGASTHEARATCAACPVAVQCLDYALENNERFGIWGGASERQRRRMRTKRLAVTPSPHENGCKCDPCRARKSAQQAAWRLNRGPLAPDDPRHGTANGYTNWSCRCEPCRTAHYAAKYRRQRGEAA